MIGLLVVTHGKFGEELIKAAQMILGDFSGCKWVCVDNQKSMDKILEEIEQKATEVNEGKGVLILTDMFGGTPTNLSLSLLGKREDIEVVTGVNLPMLIKAVNEREKELRELALTLKSTAKQSIKVAGEILKKPLNG
ncbi:MAG: mannose system component [Desulfonauticus sp.]|jgi:PTS system mannose-specific IIA component|nr:MAG: PTS system fructose subfamily IIA component [Desulfonauticus sp. 38_4375]MDK2920846.1 mannose system component [Desulfonauticus sp.]